MWGDGPYHYFEHPGCASGATPYLGSLDTRDADFYYFLLLVSRITEYFTNLMIIFSTNLDLTKSNKKIVKLIAHFAWWPRLGARTRVNRRTEAIFI